MKKQKSKSKPSEESVISPVVEEREVDIVSDSEFESHCELIEEVKSITSDSENKSSTAE
jgi:hypothetical protein